MAPNALTTPHQYPGTLIVVEGIDGSGKTTQLDLLAKWLHAAGHRVFATEWNSSALVKAATKAENARPRSPRPRSACSTRPISRTA